MKRLSYARHLSLIIAVVAVIAWARPQAPNASAQNAQVIEVTAKKYEYDPPTIHLKQGTPVELRFTAIDHTHGFQISPVPAGADKDAQPGLIFSTARECWTLEKGKVTSVEFVAKTPGTYPFHCCHFCGFGHKRMKGELVVDP
ncbi:MAG: cupredoxin domain-containing protein [Acidobacteriota bacterium]|nr:cupredoxin domain-containing protein [Acidobacteriota bacterium]